MTSHRNGSAVTTYGAAVNRDVLPALSPIERVEPRNSRRASGGSFVTTFSGRRAALSAIEAAGGRRVPVRLWNPAEVCGIQNHQHATRGWALLSDVIEYIEARGEMFEDGDEDVSIFAPVDQIAPALHAAIRPPADLPPPHCSHLWIGGKGQRTSLHYDPWPNYNFQLRGEKRFIVFPAADAALLRPRGGASADGGEFEVDPMTADLEQCPELSNTRGGTVVLRAGEVIFIPPNCPHQVVYQTPIAVNLNIWGAGER